MDVLHLEVTPWEVTDASMREHQQERIRGEREDLIIFVEHPPPKIFSKRPNQAE